MGSDTVRTNANADAWSANTPFTPEQQAMVEAEADLFYDDFVARVAQARKMSVEQVEAVAQGRVWTGADALERGLVDELGGLRTAVRRAKMLAGLDADAEVRLANYPGSSLLDHLRPRGVLAAGGRVGVRRRRRPACRRGERSAGPTPPEPDERPWTGEVRF